MKKELINMSEFIMNQRFTNLGEVISMLQQNMFIYSFDANSDFSLIWNVVYKSFFIESLLLGISIPPFYLCEEDSKFSVFFGLQQLLTLDDFVKNNFPLTRLEFFKSDNGKKYDDLSNEQKRLICGTKIVLNIIDKQTHWSVKEKIFVLIRKVLLNQDIESKFLVPGST